LSKHCFIPLSVLSLRLIVPANISERDRYPMKLKYHLAVIASVSMFSLLLHAEEEQFIDAPPPPIVMVPDDAYMHEESEPEITIVQKKNAIHEEHRLNGRLYMIKVTPSQGIPYYFLDHDGDGLLETRLDSKPEPTVPQWVLFKW
jgi:hypothetical protein